MRRLLPIIIVFLSLLISCLSTKEYWSPPEELHRLVETERDSQECYNLTLKWLNNINHDENDDPIQIDNNNMIRITKYFNILSSTNHDLFNIKYDDDKEAFIIPTKAEISIHIVDERAKLNFSFTSSSDAFLGDEYAGYANSFASDYSTYIKPLAKPILTLTTIVNSFDGTPLYIPGNDDFKNGGNNVDLINSMISQFSHRAVVIAFKASFPQYSRFIVWMINNYQMLRISDQEGYIFVDRESDNDFIIIVNCLNPGINISVMSYEYYRAMH